MRQWRGWTGFHEGEWSPPQQGTHASPKLWVRGRWPSSRPWVAVVGSRRATAAQCEMARTVAAAVTAGGGTVVSGGAIGIDGEALSAAIAHGGPALAVLPRAPDRPYPPTHTPLFDQIVAHGGAVVGLTGVPDPMPRWAFARRNVLMVDMVDAVVAVAAGLPSGTLQAVAAAGRAGLPVAHVPWPTAPDIAEGSRLLGDLGVPAVEGSADLATWLSASVGAATERTWRRPWWLAALTARVAACRPQRPPVASRARPVDVCLPRPPSYARDSDPPAVAALLQLLDSPGHDGLTLEALIECLDAPRGVLAPALLTLVLRGDVVQRGDGAYVAAEAIG